jgi:hypothetical protein
MHPEQVADELVLQLRNVLKRSTVSYALLELGTHT